MSTFGYHRTSTKDQHLDRGITEIERYCLAHNIELAKIFTDQQTGKNFSRPRYTVLKEDVLQPKDTLIVTELDRLGRNKSDIIDELYYFKEKGVLVRILELPTTLIDYDALMNNELAGLMMETINNMVIEIYAALAQAEMHKKEKRQREGIEAKKARGEWDDYGRPRRMPQDQFEDLYKKNIEKDFMRPVDFRKKFDFTIATYYKYRNIYLESKQGKKNLDTEK